MPCPICQGGYGGRHESWCPRGSWYGWWHWHISSRIDEAISTFLGELLIAALILAFIVVAYLAW